MKGYSPFWEQGFLTCYKLCQQGQNFTLLPWDVTAPTDAHHLDVFLVFTV